MIYKDKSNLVAPIVCGLNKKTSRYSSK